MSCFWNPSRRKRGEQKHKEKTSLQAQFIRSKKKVAIKSPQPFIYILKSVSGFVLLQVKGTKLQNIRSINGP